MCVHSFLFYSAESLIRYTYIICVCSLWMAVNHMNTKFVVLKDLEDVEVNLFACIRKEFVGIDNK